MASSAPHVVYISNLPHDAHEPAIREAFESQKIAVASVQLLKKGSLKRCNLNSGLACVTLTRQCDIASSCKLLDGKDLQGRPMILRADRYVSDKHNYVPGDVDSSATQQTPAAKVVAQQQQ